VGNEELAAAGVFSGVRHGEGSSRVFVSVEVSLALDLVAGPAGADARIVGILGEGIAALNHEVRDDPMKPGTVIELAVGQLLEVLHGLGDFLIEQLGGDRPLSGRYGCGLWHGFLRYALSRNVHRPRCCPVWLRLCRYLGPERLQGYPPGGKVSGRWSAAGASAGIASRRLTACQHGAEHGGEGSFSGNSGNDRLNYTARHEAAERGPMHVVGGRIMRLTHDD